MAYVPWILEHPTYRWAAVAGAGMHSWGERLAQFLGGWKDGDDLSPADTADPETVALLQYLAAILGASEEVPPRGNA